MIDTKLPDPTQSTTRTRRRVGWLGASLLTLGALLGPAISTTAGAEGNNGTLKVHELGTPSGTESNDPKVCAFNFEGFGFDAGQDGYIIIAVQGGDEPIGADVPAFAVGPANADGYFETAYFNVEGGVTVEDGHYKATLYGKDTGGDVNLEDEKAKSKVFKVECDEPDTTTTTTTTTDVSGATTTTTDTTTVTQTTDTTVTLTTDTTVTLTTDTTVTDTTDTTVTSTTDVTVTDTTDATVTSTDTVSGTTSNSSTGSVSGTVGGPAPTLPPTSTVGSEPKSHSGVISLALLVLGSAMLALAMVQPLVARKVSDR